MNSIYLSPAQPRWSPTYEQDLQDALAMGLLEETHHLDIKREVPTTRAANKELARDLAQFAVDGGTLLIGVDEVAGAPPALAPTALSGLSERVEQVARSAVDPPLYVASTAIPSAANPDVGYLLVHVPASASAPHMVDGVYYGRGDKVRSRLSDVEVRRLHQGQASAMDAVQAELSRYVSRDPVPKDLRRQAHLFAVAVPATPKPEMLLGLTGADDAYTRLFGLLQRGGNLPYGLGDSFAPRLLSATSLHRRSDGMALTYGLASGRELEERAPGRFIEDALEVEFGEDGVLRLMTTRLSDDVGGDQGQQVFATMMPILVRQFVGVAAATSQEVGYGGVWNLGVGATGVAGLHLYGRDGGFGATGRVSTDLEFYERFTSGAVAEMVQQPGPVAQRLVGRFVRGVGAESWEHVIAALN